MLSWIWPSSLARARSVGHQEAGVPCWTLQGQEMLGGHTGKLLCRAGLPDSVLGDSVFEGVAGLGQWARGSCRLSGMSLDT